MPSHQALSWQKHVDVLDRKPDLVALRLVLGRVLAENEFEKASAGTFKVHPTLRASSLSEALGS
jgi:hypothetical protein